MTKVPNKFPAIDPGAVRLAAIGQSPGEREVQQNGPFVGPSGGLLDNLLGHAGISREMIFIGNVSQVRPRGNQFDTFDWNGPEVQEGISQLRADLEAYKPTMILCLGNEALHLFKTGNVAPPKAKRGGKLVFVWPHAISTWRGSLFESKWPCRACTNRFELAPEDRPSECKVCGATDWEGEMVVKCMATYHPAALLRQPDLQAYVKPDLARVAHEMRTSELVLPKRDVQIHWQFDDAFAAINYARCVAAPASIDSEGGSSGITAFGWSFHPSGADVIPFIDKDGRSVFTEEQEVVLLNLIKEWMEDSSKPKILQNYLSDAFVLGWAYGITLAGLQHDTLALAWEAEPELDKDLQTLASLYTREPVWKTRENYRDRLAWVCGMDAAVTLEVCNVLVKKVYGQPNQTTHERSHPSQHDQRAGQDARNPSTPSGGAAQLSEGDRPVVDRLEDASFKWLQTPADHYQFNLDCLPPTLYMMLRGIKFDKAAAEQALAKLDNEIYATQHQLNVACGRAADAKDCLQAATKAFARKNPRDKSTTTIERWQPMRWNGKKWVKGGKLVDGGIAAECYTGEELPPVKPGDINVLPWLKPVHKTAPCSIPATITTWPQLEKHCRPKAKKDLRRVIELLEAYDTRPNVEQTVVSGSSEGAGGCDSLLGELENLLGLSVNINSTGQGKDCQWLLFEAWGLPKKFKKGFARTKGADDEGEASEPGLTTDDQALLEIYLKTQDPRVKLVLKMRTLVKERSFVRMPTDADGRVRPDIGLVATPTGRMAMRGSPTHTSKVNMQTITKRLRHLWIADGVMIQRDLAGADGWTVACHCKALGDSTMFDDFRAKLKPQSILALIYKQGQEVNELDRATLKDLIKQHIDESHWSYMGFKRVAYLSAYDGREKQMSESILKDSWKKGEEPVYVSPETCKDMQEKAYFVRYGGVRNWQQMWATRLLKDQVVQLKTSYGHVHTFHGRKKEWRKGMWQVYGETLRYILACEAQLNTTHMLKRAMWRLWYDKDNRYDGDLRVEPLLVVHDSLLTQCADADKDFALAAEERYFDNPVAIAGVTVTIPASSEVGKNWGFK